MQSRNTSRSICAGTVCRCENVTANTVNNAAPLQREVEILALPWLDLGRPPCLYHHFQRLPPNHHPESRLSPAAAAEEAGRGVAAAVAERGCESSPSSSTSHGRTCAREPPDGRVAAAPVRGVSGAHNERREATASATNRLRIVAAAKAASPPASLHHPRCAARLPRPRTPPPRNSRRIHRYPSPLHPCCDDCR